LGVIIARRCVSRVGHAARKWMGKTYSKSEGSDYGIGVKEDSINKLTVGKRSFGKHGPGFTIRKKKKK